MGLAVYIVFIGPPGAGKGTQAELVAFKLGLEHIAPGDLFRQAVKRGDGLGSEVKGYMERGVLVPDDITIRVILEELDNLNNEAGVILDGFPRNNNQAKALDTALEKQNKAIEHVVYIKVDRLELIRRLSNRWLCRECQTPHSLSAGQAHSNKQWCSTCGGSLYQRPDDKPETVERRLLVYFDETSPLIDYYRNQGKLVEISGEGKVEEIQNRIIKVLGLKGGNHHKD